MSAIERRTLFLEDDDITPCMHDTSTSSLECDQTSVPAVSPVVGEPLVCIQDDVQEERRMQSSGGVITECGVMRPLSFTELSPRERRTSAKTRVRRRTSTARTASDVRRQRVWLVRKTRTRVERAKRRFHSLRNMLSSNDY